MANSAIHTYQHHATQITEIKSLIAQLENWMDVLSYDPISSEEALIQDLTLCRDQAMRVIAEREGRMFPQN